MGHWCFVEDSCGTTNRGIDSSCPGAKFAFVDCHIPSYSSDTRQYCAIPQAVPNCSDPTLHMWDGTTFTNQTTDLNCDMSGQHSITIAVWVKVDSSAYSFCVVGLGPRGSHNGNMNLCAKTDK